ncbi:MAG TPA: PRC-barrel domain-containing protein [Chthoniobacterales bacterium]|nr:PRC-barrel domain-containing protein [Chthoniobacterales bacterium]
MLHSVEQRYGEKLRATDGEIGHVRDFYIDDKNWSVRYVVADTGGWLSGRLVLISPHSLGHLHPYGKVLLVNLTREQIENSPSIDKHQAVSRQHEEDFYRYYHYPYYAQSWPLWGLADYPVIAPPPPTSDTNNQPIESHLRSARFLEGYQVEASDGVIGKLSDFMIDGRTWMVREIVVESNWGSGTMIHISTDKISRISYDDATVYVELPIAAIVEVEAAAAGARRTA